MLQKVFPTLIADLKMSLLKANEVCFMIDR